MNIRQEAAGLVPDEDLFATADGRLVGADDPAAAELVARAGQPIREKTAQRLGIQAAGAGKAKPAEPKAEDKPEEREHVLGEGEPEIKRRKIASPQGK